MQLAIAFLLSIIALAQGVLASPNVGTPQAYGPYVVNQVWQDFSYEIRPWDWTYINRETFTAKEREFIIEPLIKVYEVAFKAGVIAFKPGSDPMFQLHDGQPPRTAVTGNYADSPIYFNLDIINNSEQFGYAKAIGLLIHELGHKIPRAQITQSEVDTVAAKFETLASLRESSYMFEDKKGSWQKISIFNLHDDFRIQWSSTRKPIARRLPLVGILRGSDIIPIEALVLKGVLDFNDNPKEKEIYLQLHIGFIQAETLNSAGLTRFWISFKHRTDIKNDDTYYLNKKYHAERSEIEIDLDNLLTPVIWKKSILTEMGKISVAPNLYVSADTSQIDSGIFAINGYVDFRSWPKVGRAFRYKMEIVTEVDGIRIAEPIKIIGGETSRIYSEEVVTATFRQVYTFKVKKGFKYEFIAIKAEVPMTQNGPEDTNVFFIPPKNAFCFEVKPK